MRDISRSQRIGFRRAVIASAAIHLALFTLVVAVVMLQHTPTKPGQSAINTRIHDVTIEVETEEALTFTPRETKRVEQTPAPSTSQTAPTQLAHPPTITAIPNSLPPEFLAIIHHSQNANVPVNPIGPLAGTNTDTNVKPASSISTSSTSPLHGAMRPDQSVVYILDCSGSMGEFGKLALARTALIATLHGQPEGVRFQVISYNSTARPLLPGGLIAIATNIISAETRLATLEPAGRSNHMDALRIAVGLRPDAIVWLTDADDLSALKLKPILGGAGKVLPVYVMAVTARGIGKPQELR